LALAWDPAQIENLGGLLVNSLTQPKVGRPTLLSDARAISLKIGAVFLRLLEGVLAFLLVLPVILLPLATSVPAPLWVLLWIVDLVLAGALIWFKGSTTATLAVLAGLLISAAAAIVASQVYASTPPILDAEGSPLPNSIASLEKVNLNGSEQWVSIRGNDRDNPGLLFLAGGPGGSQMTTARHALSDLEEHFVVVQWDQPGAGKSFHAVDRSQLTPGRYLEDGLALVGFLRQRFGQEKVFVLGESWGSALGIWMVQQEPEMFHAFVGTGQMVAFLETDEICYEFALRLAEERGDQGKIEQLQRQGPPPYYGKGVAQKQLAYLMDTYAYMNQNPDITGGFNTLGDLASPEYGLYDKVNWARGPLDTLGIVFQQLWEVDLRAQAPRLEVPVYFLIGRHDVNAPVFLAEEYFELLSAPHKELVWFERSGHTPWTSEPGKFVDEMVNRVLAQTLVKVTE
jgi:pimeloyl-ACP methyl ester carboxylesterase